MSAMRSTLTVTLAAAATAPLLLFATTMVVAFDNAQQTAVERQVRALARAAEARIEAEFARHTAALQTLAALTHVQADLIAPGIDLDEALRANSAWCALFLSGPAGIRIPSGASRGNEQPLDISSGRPAQTRIGDVSTTTTCGGKPSFSIHVPIVQDGGFQGFLTARVHTSALSYALREIQTDMGAVIAALDRDGVIGARNMQSNDYVGLAATASLRQALHRSAQDFFLADTQEGERVYTALQTSDRSGWTVAVGAPAELVEVPLQRSRLAILLGLVGIAAMTGLLAWNGLRNARLRRIAETEIMRLDAERRSEQRLSEIASNLPGGIYRHVRHPDGRTSHPYTSPGAEAVFLLNAEETALPASLDDHPQLVVSEDRERWRRAVSRSEATLEPYDVEACVQLSGGHVRWLRSRANPYREPDGSTIWDGVIIDITDLKEAEQRQRMLMAEVDHRSKNALAAVLSIIRATRAENMKSYAERVESRVTALARAHVLLARAGWCGIDLRALIKDEVSSSCSACPIELDGPEVTLSAEATQPLVVVFHELLSNARRHGSLSTESGSLKVAWSVSEGAVAIVWQEQGGSSGDDHKDGLGLTLVRSIISIQLGGAISWDWMQSGLDIVITLPSSLIGSIVTPMSPD